MMSQLGIRDTQAGQRLVSSVGARPSISEYINMLRQHRSSVWAWQHYKDVVADLIRIRGATRILEIGGGRFPLFDNAETRGFGVRYCVNDISEAELELAPSGIEKACFDIARPTVGDIRSLQGQIDVAFSKMVFEHLPGALQAYESIFQMLSWGGICFNFHPVLWSPPFVVNYIMPTGVTRKVLQRLSKKRNPCEEPKFPAFYDHCIISSSERRKLRDIGYRSVWQLPFWYHEYFAGFPGVSKLDNIFNRVADRRDWTLVASYCYTIVMK